MPQKDNSVKLIQKVVGFRKDQMQYLESRGKQTGNQCQIIRIALDKFIEAEQLKEKKEWDGIYTGRKAACIRSCKR